MDGLAGDGRNDADVTREFACQADAWDCAYGRRGAAWNGRIPALPDLPGGSVALDLGCGDGRVLCAMLERGWKAVGVDFSRNGLAKAAERPAVARALQSGAAELVLADAVALPFKDGTFDVVAAVHILAHLDEKERSDAVREVCRVLKPGGRVVFTDFSKGDFRSMTGKEVGGWTRHRNGVPTHYFGVDEVSWLLSGFTLENIGAVGWDIRVRGGSRRREEIVATGVKPTISGEP